ncbi:MAG: hypothetical protein IBJ03_06770 [Gemmatimonadaceae bacterium]|nr:hypothetical protein [Gemmatimonadaceae bacterium]
MLISCQDHPVADSARREAGSAVMASDVTPGATDSASQLYLNARVALEQDDTTSALQQLDRVIVGWSQSNRGVQAMYWKAFILYRRGAASDLKTASRLLELATQLAPTTFAIGDASTLLLRIRVRLANAGDSDAIRELGFPDHESWTACRLANDANQLARVVSAGDSPERQMVLLRDIMDDPSVCAAPTREQALLILARIPNGLGVSSLVKAIEEDGSLAVRRTALRVLPRPAPDTARNVLRQVLVSATDVTSLEAAASAWASRLDWGIEPLHAYLRRSDRNATVVDYVTRLLTR